ncbi:low molecular weight phosphatase family protein [Ornithinimicrobium sp. Y1694]|uniref:arsenate reductase/protein-tyrosine-phosphatase family protein n=1 Tax=Ornithinimicrobium sp. Y1694 TaxID=3418590 RepID=UPI003CED3FBF
MTFTTSTARPQARGILVVCTGNVCRSPMVERLLQAALDQRYGAGLVPVSSAGTGALVGSAMDERSAELLAQLGGDDEGFTARAITEPIVAGAQLVLTATRDHRASVVRLHPRAMRRSFTVRELGLALAAVPEQELPTADDPLERLTEVAELGNRLRGAHLPATPEDLDLTDPFRQPDEVYRELRGQVEAALPGLLRGLVGPAR